jgi:hypothetical protein
MLLGDLARLRHLDSKLPFTVLAMTFQTKPASNSDLDTLADVLVKAHANDTLFQRLLLRVPHELRVTWYADAFRMTWEEKWIRYYKVVELETRYASLHYSDWYLSRLFTVIFIWLFS